MNNLKNEQTRNAPFMQLMGRSDPREMAMADHSMTAWHLLTGFVQQHVQRATCAYLCPLLKGQKDVCGDLGIPLISS